MTPAEMDAELPPKFEALKAFDAPLFHYKICSTFDSSPTIGSIGHAAEVGFRIFEPPVVPLMVGAPALKRYVVFGNLFATVGDQTFRLDRHPTMSKHPITPMDESDLRLHLGKQTARRIGLIDCLHLAQGDDRIDARFRALIDDGCQIVLFDTLDVSHLPKIGRVVWSLRGDKPIFIVASSGIEYALTAYWQSIGMVEPPAPLPCPGAVDQLIVISGSAAPGTAAQIDWAIQNGYAPIRLDSPGLVDPATVEAPRQQTIDEALSALSAGRSVVMFSALGPDDPAIAETKRRLTELGLDPNTVGWRLGPQQGMILKALLEKTRLKRACVAGGDTCGHAARQLGIYALEIVIPIAPGSPLCRARSNDARFDNLEVSLIAGQVGKPDYFGSIQRGSA
jgi:uncharacterized protein YgbK (DUF1537 family)